MAVLNITYNGLSADYPLDMSYDLSDTDVRRIATEVVRSASWNRSGGVRGLVVSDLPQHAFDNYVIDRFRTAQGERIYLRPKVPFGSRV